jgi:hypothetical protein
MGGHIFWKSETGQWPLPLKMEEEEEEEGEEEEMQAYWL